MPELIYSQKRTHRCGSLREADAGNEVVLMGWVHHRRDHGGCVFVDLRDREGVTQIVFDPSIDATAHAAASDLRSEWVIGVVGKVCHRGGNINDRLATGAIEVMVHTLEIFSEAQTPPFLIDDHGEASEEVRLKHRYLDLRRPGLQKNLERRHRFLSGSRRVLESHGFWELETPFLIRSTPEGARDYVVPSRVHAGKFFALPQSPQIFKQLFMVAGYDRYFQVARCFRDEDLRAERQPEFTQIDVEMSFCTPEDVQQVVEDLLKNAWAQLAPGCDAPTFERITYAESIRRFGLDAPDLRFGLELVDLSPVLADTKFKVFAGALSSGGVVKGINLKGMEDLSRKDLDGFTEFVSVYGAKGLAWVKVKADGSWQSPIAKFLEEDERDRIAKTLELAPGDVAVFVADSARVAHAALGNLRKHVAKLRGCIPEGVYRFCWVTDFPLVERDADNGRWTSTHHPFTAPHPDDVALLETDPEKVRALAYDVVLNGIEIGGGSIRIHKPKIQKQMFELLGIGDEEAQAKFGFLLEALAFGAPPHGGVALGVDRIMMLLCNTPSIRDVIAFPKTQKQTDLMLNAPSSLDPHQLVELSLGVKAKTP